MSVCPTCSSNPPQMIALIVVCTSAITSFPRFWLALLEPTLQASENTAVPGIDRQGTSSRWQRLVAAFHLTLIESDALLICLLPEIDLKYSRIFAYLQDDVTLKRPTVDLVLNLLCSSLAERVSARQLFADEAPLLRQQLLCRVVPGGGELSLLNHCL